MTFGAYGVQIGTWCQDWDAYIRKALGNIMDNGNLQSFQRIAREGKLHAQGSMAANIILYTCMRGFYTCSYGLHEMIGIYKII